MEPPRFIPDNLRNDYTLNGKIPLYNLYLNSSVKENSVTWSNSYIQSFIDRFTIENIKSGNAGYETYVNGAKFHLQAFEKYINSIKNKKVAVIGSETPWIESILVNCGAKEVVTVEYNVPKCEHNIIRSISYNDFCNSSEKYDAIVSYSSIEHSGLGRYGDELNPNADIETMQQIYRCLKDDGLCFVGFPVGKDYVVWNAHRIYGNIRLKLLFLDKFKELEWIGCNRNIIFNTPFLTIGNPRWDIQPVIILQKPLL
jgi:hypothetical protein